MARPTASNINTTDIDEQYPVAGVDNDSQGFRDNFDTIKSNFVSAKSEIEDLQDNTARLDVDNDFGLKTIERANFVNTTQEIHANGNLTSGQNISFENGHYQTVGVGANLTLTLSDWPESGKLGKMRVVLRANDSSGPYTVTWAAAGAGTIKDDGNAIWSAFSVSSTTNPIIVDFWTEDSGTVVFAQYIGTFS